MTTTTQLLAPGERWRIDQGDAVEWLRGLPADSVDLVFGSPPYEQCRLYLEGGVNLGVSRKTDAWVSWMTEVYVAAQQACRGLVAFVVAGQTRSYRWSAGPALLMASLHAAGLNLRNPPIFHRVGIPGSGGPDWLRGDTEFIVCTSRPGRLPWSENTAMGHPPRWAPGGEMSHRLSDGQRVNQWGKCGTESVNGHAQRKKDGRRQKAERPSHVMTTKRRVTRGHKDGDTPNSDSYSPPSVANPGNRIQYTPSEYEIISFLEEYRRASGNQDAGEVVRSLQEAIRAKTLAMWLVGANMQIQGAALLQPSLHGGSQGEESSGSEKGREGQIQSPGDVQRDEVSQMRSEKEPCKASRRRRPDEQPPGECQDSLPALPHVPSQSVAAQNLPDLREEAPFVRFVRCSLLPIQEAWRSAEEMSQQSLWYRGASSSLIHLNVGGGTMGSELAHLNEAPYPEALCEFFIRSFCPPGGLVVDPFSGSGTTLAVAVAEGRRGLACDLRQSQVDLGRRRLEGVTPTMFPA